jgi:chemotaxis-related protein WspD
MSTSIALPEHPPDCWKRIGVWGKQRPRCERLGEVIHCRNCEVFTRAGRNLLERELPADYMREWTQVLATKKADEPLGTVSLLVFRIEREWLALPTLLFAEVIDPAPIHGIPHRKHPALLGLINVHGEVQLCVSLQALLGMESAREKKHTSAYQRMIVLDDRGKYWVFPVDEIHGIYRLRLDCLALPPASVGKAGAGFSKGLFSWENKQVDWLDEELLLYQLRRSVQ